MLLVNGSAKDTKQLYLANAKKIMKSENLSALTEFIAKLSWDGILCPTIQLYLLPTEKYCYKFFANKNINQINHFPMNEVLELHRELKDLYSFTLKLLDLMNLGESFTEFFNGEWKCEN